MRLFLSYSFSYSDEIFVNLVSFYLSKQENLDPFCWTVHGRANDDFQKQLMNALSTSEGFLLFLGKELGETQYQEAIAASLATNIKHKVVIMPKGVSFPDRLRNGYGGSPIVIIPQYDTHARKDDAAREDAAVQCATQIVRLLDIPWVPIDEIPNGYLFDYEKSIIDEYVQANGQLPMTRIEQGCPPLWPKVEKSEGKKENPIRDTQIGLYRDWDYVKGKLLQLEPQVIPAALSAYHIPCPIEKNMTFPEAGPRKMLRYPNQNGNWLRVGILVSGGIAPGINSVINGVVERQFLYAREGHYERTLRVLGYENGFNALLNAGLNYRLLDDTLTKNKSNDAGSLIGCSRVEELVDPSPTMRSRALEQVVNRLLTDGVQILYIIGGHGSMRAAHSIWKVAKDMGRDLSVIGIPKTMDNDILFVWQSFGFMSAVERAKELIGYMCTEVNSNPGLCVIQLFGSDSGFVPSHAVLASGECDVCLIPEVEFSMAALSNYINNKLITAAQNGSPHCIVVMSETAVPKDVNKYLDDPDVALTEEEKSELNKYLGLKNRRLPGHTPDPMRTGTLKVVSRVLYKNIRELGNNWTRFRMITNEPKHQLRAIPPSCSDTIFGRRLGSLAVDGAMAGYSDFMISQWLTEYVMVPLRLVILGRKRVPKTGIFWNSVRDSTGQPEDLK
jgi:6-phosphofructokinase 1